MPAGPPRRADGTSFFALAKPVVAPPRSTRYEKWCRWLKDIDSDITTLYGNRQVWQTINKIVGQTPDLPPSHFFDFLAEAYAMSEAMGVRRQAETNRQTKSLGTMLAEIAATPEVLSRQRYVALWDVDMQRMGSDEFDEWAEPSGQHIDPELVHQDLHALTSAAAGIKRYVDKHVAHYDRKPLTQLPTFEDLHTAVDELGQVFQRYHHRLTATSRAVMVPVPQYDWLAPFRVPWLTKDQPDP